MLNLTAVGYVSGAPKIESGDYGESCTISLRCTGSDRKHVFYVNAKFYGKRMKVIEDYIQDGKQVTVTGSVRLAIEKAKKDGTKYTQVYMDGHDFTLPAREDSAVMSGAKSSRRSAPVPSEEEVPF